MILQKNPLIASGESVHANMYVKLWENPDSTVDFAAQTIELSSGDYDFLLIEGKYRKDDARIISTIFQKGESGYLNMADYESGVSNLIRAFVNTDATHINVSTASQNNTVNNRYLVPTVIYGFKKSLDITAIVSNVSTDARQCMLSDGVTSVSDVLESPNNLGSAISVPFGADYIAPSDGYLQISILVNKELNVKIKGSDNGTAITYNVKNVTGTGNTYSLYVRKGMIIRCYNTSSEGSLNFTPFT